MSDDDAYGPPKPRNPHVEMIWGLLAPYIASEDPPDLSNDGQADILTAGALPQMWGEVLALESELAQSRERNKTLTQWLGVMLDQIDYTSGACGPTEMVAACLSTEVIAQVKEALAAAWEKQT